MAMLKKLLLRKTRRAENKDDQSTIRDKPTLGPERDLLLSKGNSTRSIKAGTTIRERKKKKQGGGEERERSKSRKKRGHLARLRFVGNGRNF